MADDVRTVRLPSALWEQLDAMANHLKDDPELTLHGAVTRSTIFRLALAHGLKVMRRRHGTPEESDS